MPSHLLQASFSGGEFAPSLYSRVDLQKYASGVKRARNFFVHPHGGASNRPGTQYKASVKTAADSVRLIPFVFSDSQAYVLEFGDKYCRFYNTSGQILSGASPYEIVTPYADEDLVKLQYTQSADTLYITHPDYAPQCLCRFSDTNWTITAFDFINGPFMVSNDDAASTITPSAVSGSITLTAAKDIFDADHVGALWRIRHYIPGQSYSGTITGSGAGTSILCGGTWRLITHGNWDAIFDLEMSTDGGSTWSRLRTFSSKMSGGVGDFNANTYGTRDGQYKVRINVTTYTSGAGYYDLTSDPYEHAGIVEISAFTDSKHAAATVVDALGSTSASSDWAEGSWSEYRGYPSAVAFYQDRIIFGGSYSEPQTIWTSKSSEFTDFGRSTPLVDSDGISINLPNRRLSQIRSLLGVSEIVALTSDSEWTIGATDNGVMTPTSVATACQGFRGSSYVPPVIIGNRIVFIQPMGALVRDLGYDYSVNGYSGDQLGIFSNHLFTGHTIVDMAYQAEPDGLTWFVRDDGVLLTMTYLREQEMLAWTWHDTDGEVESICSIPDDGYDSLWLVVKRGSSKFVEKMVQRSTSTSPEDQFFVDCGVTYPYDYSATIAYAVGQYVRYDDKTYCCIQNGTNKTPDTETAYWEENTFSSVSGLTWLEGETVAILADGNVMPQQTVASGAITLNPEASYVHIGLPYTAELETLNPELPLKNGTSQGRKMRIPEVTLRFLNSRGGWVGPDSSNLKDIVYRTTELIGEPIALFTGDMVEQISSSYGTSVGVFYQQVDPLPVTLLAVIPRVELGG